MRRAIICLLCIPLLFALIPEADAAALIVYRHAGSDGQKRVAITFDDGPHPKYTPEILDILAEFSASATFFAVGENAKAYPELIKRAHSEGHEIGNHTYHHYHIDRMDDEALSADIQSCTSTIEALTGERVRLFRPPEGVCSKELKSFCTSEGLTIVLWSVDTRDWAHTPESEILSNIRENVRNGSIILMHDFIGKNSPTPAALRRIIPMLQESGYELVTVSQLLES